MYKYQLGMVSAMAFLYRCRCFMNLLDILRPCMNCSFIYVKMRVLVIQYFFFIAFCKWNGPDVNYKMCFDIKDFKIGGSSSDFTCLPLVQYFTLCFGISLWVGILERRPNFVYF